MLTTRRQNFVEPALSTGKAGQAWIRE